MIEFRYKQVNCYQEAIYMKATIALLIAAVALVLPVAHAWAEEPEPVPYVAVVGADGKQVVEITGGEYYFEPEHIVLKANVPAVFIVKRTGYIVPHNIKVEHPDAGMAFDVDMSKAGTRVEFTPTKAGTYPFFCDKKLLFFESHKQKGMEGVIEVVE